LKYSKLLIVGVLFASAAGFAGTTRYTATLAQPLPKHKDVIGNHNIWRCTETTCVLTSAPNDVEGVSSCRELKREVGALTAYGAAEKPFDAEKLAKCNS